MTEVVAIIAVCALAVVTLSLVWERAAIQRAALPYAIPVLRGVAKLRDSEAAAIERQAPRPPAPPPAEPSPDDIAAAEAVFEHIQSEDLRLQQMAEGSDAYNAANEALSVFIDAHAREMRTLKRLGRRL